MEEKKEEKATGKEERIKGVLSKYEGLIVYDENGNAVGTIVDGQDTSLIKNDNKK